MKFVLKPLLVTLFCAILMAGCASFESIGNYGDFSRPTDMSSYDSFRYDHTMISGMVYRNRPQELVMKSLSEQVLTQEFSQRGYASAGQDADFYVVSKWRKEVNMSAAAVVRFSLIVEIYESSNKTLFWRAELPYIFNAMQWSEERVSQTLRLAVQNFPEHYSKVTELPSVE